MSTRSCSFTESCPVCLNNSDHAEVELSLELQARLHLDVTY